MAVGEVACVAPDDEDVVLARLGAGDDETAVASATRGKEEDGGGAAELRTEPPFGLSLAMVELASFLASSPPDQRDDDQSEDRNDEGPQRRGDPCETSDGDEDDVRPLVTSEDMTEQDQRSTADKRTEPEGDSAISRDDGAGRLGYACGDVQDPEKDSEDVRESSARHAAVYERG